MPGGAPARPLVAELVGTFIQTLIAALDQAAPADKSNKLGWLRWLEIQD